MQKRVRGEALHQLGCPSYCVWPLSTSPAFQLLGERPTFHRACPKLCRPRTVSHLHTFVCWEDRIQASSHTRVSPSVLTLVMSRTAIPGKPSQPPDTFAHSSWAPTLDSPYRWSVCSTKLADFSPCSPQAWHLVCAYDLFEQIEGCISVTWAQTIYKLHPWSHHLFCSSTPYPQNPKYTGSLASTNREARLNTSRML